MAKILGSWSGMRKYLEKEMLAESMRGRIRYNCTHYVGMDSERIIELVLDGKTYKQFSWETVQSYFHRTGLVQRQDTKFSSTAEYWKGFWKTLEKVPLTERTEYTDSEFCDAMEAYRNSDIVTSLAVDNSIQNMFAVLDRRIGKRTLVSIKDRMMQAPDWVRELYLARLKAESIA